MIRRLIVPLTAAVVSFHAGHVFAQGAFPAPLPNQSAAPANASPFPPVNGVGGAPVQSAAPASGGSVFDRGASPTGGMAPAGGPPQASGGADACMKGFVPLREEAERRGKMIKAASDRKAPPDEACKLIKNFGQAEMKMIAYVADQFGQMRNSAADRRPAQERPQEHREDADAGLQRRAAGAGPWAGRSEPERSAWLFGGAPRGADRQEGRQYLRYAERQRSPAMIPLR